MSNVKTAEEIRLLHTLCEKAFAEESGYGEVHSLTDRGVYRTFRDGFFAANRVLGKQPRARIAELEAQIAEPASRALDMLTSAALDHYTPHMVCVPSTAWSEAMRIADAAPAAAVPDDALCESLIEASDMLWNGDMYVGDGSDLMNLVRSALLARQPAPAQDVVRDGSDDA